MCPVLWSLSGELCWIGAQRTHCATVCAQRRSFMLLLLCPFIGQVRKRPQRLGTHRPFVFQVTLTLEESGGAHFILWKVAPFCPGERRNYWAQPALYQALRESSRYQILNNLLVSEPSETWTSCCQLSESPV